MAKEILLYSSIYSYSAAMFINELEANKSNDIRVRGNCPGGDMFGAYGMIAKFQEHQKSKEIHVDGIAASAFAYMLCFADKVTCLDASMFLFHRAAFGSIEDERMLDEGQRKVLDNVNAKIREGLETKVTNERFKQVTGVGYDELFATDKRIDVILTAQQMKDLGLITEIIALTPSRKSEIMALSATYGVAAFAKEPIIENSNNNIVMTAQEFKAANAVAYDEIVKEGVKKERERVSALMVYNEYDPKAVSEAIENGTEITPKMMAEFGLKAAAIAQLKAVESDTPPAVATTEQGAAVTAEAANLAKFNEEVKKHLKKI